MIYDDLFEGRRAVSEGDRLELAGDADRPILPQIVNPERYAPELLETVAYANAASIALALLGDEATPGGMHAIRKPAHHGAATPWHQDEAYWAPTHDHDAISVWMPLQPATLENGCMQFVRGSQHDAVRPHRLISPDAHGLVVDARGRRRERRGLPDPRGRRHRAQRPDAALRRAERHRRAPPRADHGVPDARPGALPSRTTTTGSARSGTPPADRPAAEAEPDRRPSLAAMLWR